MIDMKRAKEIAAAIIADRVVFSPNLVADLVVENAWYRHGCIPEILECEIPAAWTKTGEPVSFTIKVDRDGQPV